MNKKISIVIPTYQRPELLIRCLDAIENQDFDKEDYEVIVVSDGPDLVTRRAIQERAIGYSIRIKHLNLPEKKGPAAARNYGWLQAEGILVAFTDDDCLPDSDWLKTIWAAYDGREDVAFSGKVIVPISKEPTDYELNTSNLERAEFITANCACTKKALIKTGGFDERFELAWREDSDLHFKLLLNNIPIYKIGAVVVHPVRHAPWGVSLKEQKKGMFNALLYKKYPKLYQERIRSKAPLNYYVMVLSAVGVITGLIFGLEWLVLVCLLLWSALQLSFISKRLNATNHSPNHILEMIVTSMAIPFLSVYWQLYGAWKYRVLFI